MIAGALRDIVHTLMVLDVINGKRNAMTVQLLMSIHLVGIKIMYLKIMKEKRSIYFYSR